MWRFSCHFSVFFCHTDHSDAELCDTNWTCLVEVIDIAQRWIDQLSTLYYSEWGSDTPRSWHGNLIKIGSLSLLHDFHLRKFSHVKN